ncbi:hypothetical protein WDW89_13170 [Deltaproteobacteria bacterium TL4]
MLNRRKSLMGIILVLATMLFAADAMALGLRLRLSLPLGGSASVDGFGDEFPDAGEFGLTVLTPLKKDWDLGIGYSFFSVAVEETMNSNTTILKNQGSFAIHQLDLSTNYTGIPLNDKYDLLLSVGLQLPLFGQGKVSSEVKAITSSGVVSISESDTTSQISGGGIFLGAGVERGRWEFLLYYRQVDYSLDLVVERIDGNRYEVAFHSTEYGFSVGYIF